MANTKKYTLSITEEQIDKLKKALHVGSPISVALSFSGISYSQYYYMIEVASVVAYVKELELVEKDDEYIKSGVSFKAIKEQVEQNYTTGRKAGINTLKEPKGETILRYRNNKAFKEFADNVYEIVHKCDELRSEIVLYHLTAIRDAARQRGGNATSSQWFLERTMPEYFGKDIKQDDEKKVTQEVKVEFIDPTTKENKDRVKQMEELIIQQTGKSNNA